MDDEIAQTKSFTYLYEQDHYGGMFEYTVDNCEPFFIKFSTFVRLKVLLDKNPDYDNGNQLTEKKTHASDEEESIAHMKYFKSQHIFEESFFGENDQESDMRDGKNCESNHEEYECIPKQKKSEFAEHHVQRGNLSETVLDLSKKQEELLLATGQEAAGQRDKEGRKLSISNEKSKEEIPKTDPSRKSNKTIPKAKHKDRNASEIAQSVKPKQRKTRAIDKTNIDSESEMANLTTEGALKVTKKENRSKPGKLMLEKDVTCSYCNVTFKTKLDFFNHRRTLGAHFQCKICGKETPLEALLMVHMLSHEPHKGYVQAEGESGLKKRRNKMKCNICGLVVSSLDSLRVHMIQHTGEHPYQCCLCEEKFFSLSSLRHHQQMHRVSKRFQCKECNVRFSSRGELSKHKLTHEIKCGLCGEVFPNKTSRTCHYRVSHPDDIKKCNKCTSLFSTDEELQKHLLYHRSKKEEKCGECGVVVTRLKDHMMLHSLKEGEKMFACDQCPRTYRRKAALDKHLLVHTGERPYACDQCPKKFRGQGMLRKHLYTHTMERPFVCEFCGKQFSVRSNLIMHMRIHADTKKYPCTICLQAFNYKISLDKHLKSKHQSQETPTTPGMVTSVSNITAANSGSSCKPEEEQRDYSSQLSTNQQMTCLTQDHAATFMPPPSELLHYSQSSNNSHFFLKSNSVHSIVNFEKAPREMDVGTTIQQSSGLPVDTNTLTPVKINISERSTSNHIEERTSLQSRQSSVFIVPPNLHNVTNPDLEFSSLSQPINITLSGIEDSASGTTY